jgi:hypothetical protein
VWAVACHSRHPVGSRGAEPGQRRRAAGRRKEKGKEGRKKRKEKRKKKIGKGKGKGRKKEKNKRKERKKKGFRKLGEILGKLRERGKGFLWGFLGFSDTSVNPGTAVMVRRPTGGTAAS